MLVINQSLPERCIIVEEPEVVSIISSNLTDVKTISSRGYLIKIGKFNDIGVVISSHGVGGPSTSLILEELIENGVRIVIRYGTAGTMKEENVGKYLIPLGVSHHIYSSLYQRIRGDIIFSLFPDLELTYGLYDFLKKNGRDVIYGSVFQSDDFYAESHIKSDDGIDMETGTLYLVSRLKGVESTSLLILANYKGRWINYEEIYKRDSKLILEYITKFKQ